MGLRLAAAGALAAITLALVALPANAATPDTPAAIQIDQPGWDQNQDRDHHDRDHRNDRGDHDHDRQPDNNQPPAWTPPSTGSFG
ncbi:hypothetical protein GFY24_02045 [Nocardia sp. SYP-A9097]|nr:hypothetical protein [Nocardia sp. SYP-A9097]